VGPSARGLRVFALCPDGNCDPALGEDETFLGRTTHDGDAQAGLPGQDAGPGEPQRNGAEIGFGENGPGAALGRFEQADRPDVDLATGNLVEHPGQRRHLVNTVPLHFLAQGTHHLDAEPGHLAPGIAVGHRRRVLEDRDAQRPVANRLGNGSQAEKQEQGNGRKTESGQHVAMLARIRRASIAMARCWLMLIR